MCVLVYRRTWHYYLFG